MDLARRIYNRELKVAAMREIDSGHTIGEVADGERFPKKNFAAFQGSSPASGRPWRGCLLEEIRQAAEKGQAVSALCAMTGLSRAGYYRWRAGPAVDPVEMELRDTMQRIALEFPCYGYRRITAEMKRRGFRRSPGFCCLGP